MHSSDVCMHVHVPLACLLRSLSLETEKKINNVTNYSAIKMGKCPRELFMTAETVTGNIIDTDYPI